MGNKVSTGSVKIRETQEALASISKMGNMVHYEEETMIKDRGSAKIKDNQEKEVVANGRRTVYDKKNMVTSYGAEKVNLTNGHNVTDDHEEVEYNDTVDSCKETVVKRGECNVAKQLSLPRSFIINENDGQSYKIGQTPASSPFSLDVVRVNGTRNSCKPIQTDWSGSDIAKAPCDRNNPKSSQSSRMQGEVELDQFSDKHMQEDGDGQTSLKGGITRVPVCQIQAEKIQHRCAAHEKVDLNKLFKMMTGFQSVVNPGSYQSALESLKAFRANYGCRETCKPVVDACDVSSKGADNVEEAAKLRDIIDEVQDVLNDEECSETVVARNLEHVVEGVQTTRNVQQKVNVAGHEDELVEEVNIDLEYHTGIDNSLVMNSISENEIVRQKSELIQDRAASQGFEQPHAHDEREENKDMVNGDANDFKASGARPKVFGKAASTHGFQKNFRRIEQVPRKQRPGHRNNFAIGYLLKEQRQDHQDIEQFSGESQSVNQDKCAMSQTDTHDLGTVETRARLTSKDNSYQHELNDFDKQACPEVSKTMQKDKENGDNEESLSEELSESSEDEKSEGLNRYLGKQSVRRHTVEECDKANGDDDVTVDDNDDEEEEEVGDHDYYDSDEYEEDYEVDEEGDSNETKSKLGFLENEKHQLHTGYNESKRSGHDQQSQQQKSYERRMKAWNKMYQEWNQRMFPSTSTQTADNPGFASFCYASPLFQHYWPYYALSYGGMQPIPQPSQWYQTYLNECYKQQKEYIESMSKRAMKMKSRMTHQ